MTTFLDFARRGKNDWWRYLLTPVVAMVLFTMLATAIIAGLMISRLGPADLTDEIQRPIHPAIFFAATGIMFGALLVGFIAAIRMLHGKTFSDIVGRWDWRMFLWGAGVWLALQAALTLGDFALAPRAFTVTLSAGTPMLALFAVLGLSVQTFAEEFVFRGYATEGLLLWLRRPWIVAVASGLLFGALHIPNGGPQAVNAVFFGIVTAVIAIRTGGLAFTYGLHLVNNLWGAVIVVSANDVFHGAPGLLTQSAPQLLGWDVAAGAVCLLIPLWLTAGPLRPPADPAAPEAAFD
jgi:membrane protease YdiL (CAAX protease family)